MGIIATDIVLGVIQAMILSGITPLGTVAWPMATEAWADIVPSDTVVSIALATEVGIATIPTMVDSAIG